METKELAKKQRNKENNVPAGLTLGLGILMERIHGLPKDDKEDLYDLMKELLASESGEEFESVVTAIREILDQKPLGLKQMEQPEKEAETGTGLQRWINFVSERIRTLRKEAGLTQEELAERSGLPQSHISRLESGKHSPSRVTLEKIAAALGLPIGRFDPSAE